MPDLVNRNTDLKLKNEEVEGQRATAPVDLHQQWPYQGIFRSCCRPSLTQTILGMRRWKGRGRGPVCPYSSRPTSTRISARNTIFCSIIYYVPHIMVRLYTLYYCSGSTVQGVGEYLYIVKRYPYPQFFHRIQQQFFVNIDTCWHQVGIN